MVRDFSPFQKLYIFPISSSISQPNVISLRLLSPRGRSVKDLSNFNKELEKRILEGYAKPQESCYYLEAKTSFLYLIPPSFGILNSQNIHEASRALELYWEHYWAGGIFKLSSAGSVFGSF